jgi:GNAT superfamily N-acetyltransferase
VEGGASVGFLAPVSPETASAFWLMVADGVASGERLLLVARDVEGRVRGTVQLIRAGMENQPHRADVSKLLVHRSARRTGAGEQLMREIERRALAEGRTLLVLDTATPAAARLYERLGWTRSGFIPGYALNPDGTLSDTTFYWKALV